MFTPQIRKMKFMDFPLQKSPYLPEIFIAINAWPMSPNAMPKMAPKPVPISVSNQPPERKASRPPPARNPIRAPMARQRTKIRHKQTNGFITCRVKDLNIIIGNFFLQIGGMGRITPELEFFLCPFKGLLLGKPFFHQIPHIIAHVEDHIVLRFNRQIGMDLSFASFPKYLRFI